jgi:predicted acyl esterase
VRHGYVVIFQDCRGRNGSGGEFVKYLREGRRRLRHLRLDRRQLWSDGKIGMIGALSYAAHTQAALGCLNPPG